MQRGKIIGAIVLVAAIGIIIAERVGEPESSPANGTGGVPAGANTAGQPSPAGSAGANVSVEGTNAQPGSGRARVYTIDAAQSEVFWRIYKAGAMARLGHNHVISVSELSGTITLGSDPAAAEWSLSFPVAALVVDDPGLRARFGEDFESVPSDSDKAGTKRNMLTDEVLNGEVFAEIQLEGKGLDGTLQNAQLPVAIHLLGRTIEQRFPAAITVADGVLTVSGEYRLTHADLGMKPFTALGGLMSVGNEIDFTYRLRAVAGSR
jgi:hypothetical protein